MLEMDLKRVHFKICQRQKITKNFIGTINILVAPMSTMELSPAAIKVNKIIAGMEHQSIRSNLSVNLSFSFWAIFWLFILSV